MDATETADERLEIRLPASLLAQIEAAADGNVSAWCRRMLRLASARPLVSEVFRIELTNKNHTTRSWKADHAAKRKFAKIVSHRTPFDNPVRVVVTRILGKRQRFWDSSSGLRGNYKELEDAMVDAGWYHDDGPTWITSTEFRQDATDRKNGPAVRIDVYVSMGMTWQNHD